VPALNLRILTRRNHDKEPGVATAFLRWTYTRAVFHRGYVLTSGIYFVVNARLSASQIIGLGTVMAVTLSLSDIPAGAWSDTFSRKWPLVAGHGFLAAGMVLTGLVTAYPLILCTQVLWALGWACSGGADVAWVTDELGRPGQIARVLAARASGAAMALLGIFVAVRFPEDNFTPVQVRRWAASLRVLKRGVALARRDREILLVLAATMVVNGADMISWLFTRRLVDLGLPGDPVISYAAIGILSSAAGVIALRLVEARIERAAAARRAYVVGCLVGAAGLVMLALAPDVIVGGFGLLLASGVAFSVTRAVSVIWVNRRTPSEIRATIHSFLSQAETVGEVVGGLALVVTAQAAGLSAAFIASAVLIACVGALVAILRVSSKTVDARRGPGCQRPTENTAHSK